VGSLAEIIRCSLYRGEQIVEDMTLGGADLGEKGKISLGTKVRE